MLRLASPSARPVRRLAVQKLATALTTALQSTAARCGSVLSRPAGSAAADAALTGVVVPTNLKAVAAAAEAAAPSAEPRQPQPWPSSELSEALEQRTSARARSTGLLLLRLHVGRQVAAGWRGAAAVGAFAYVVARVGLAALVRTAMRGAAGAASTVVPKPVAATATAAVAALAYLISRELSALGASLGKLADELQRTRAPKPETE